MISRPRLKTQEDADAEKGTARRTNAIRRLAKQPHSYHVFTFRVFSDMPYGLSNYEVD